MSRHALPPGPLIELDREERADRLILMKLASAYGPVFKAMAWGELWVCITGLDRCARFIREHHERIRPTTIDITHLIPPGFLRQMKGAPHRAVRTPLIRALRDEQPARHRDAFVHIASQSLADYAARTPDAEAFIAALKVIATRSLIQLFFGAPPDSALGERLLAAFHELGPHGLVWRHGPRQIEAVHAIRNLVHADLRDRPGETDGVVRRLHAAGALDDTALVHVIIMVEMGRYDLHGLFRWLARYAGLHPSAATRVANEDDSEPAVGNSHARAFVMETLRLDQSERLLRRAEQNLVFDGCLIPRGTMVRLCLWESHKDDRHFPQPFDFQPERFRDGDLPPDQFSPFGLDEHYCPLAEPSLLLGTTFLHALCRGYSVVPIDDGPPVRGAYHWEPATSFTVRLTPRSCNP